MTPRTRYIRIILSVIPLLLILLAAIMHRQKLLHLLEIIVVAVVIAYILTPLCDVLEKKMPRTAAVAIILLVVCAGLAAFVFFFIPRMAKEAMTLIDRFPAVMQFIRQVLGGIQDRMDSMGIPKGIQDSVSMYADSFQRKATDTVMRFLEHAVSAVSLLPSLLIELILGFYFLKDREYFCRILTGFIPLTSRRTILQTVSEINHILHCFIRGEVFIAGTVGILTTAVYLLIGLPYALILGFLAGMLEFIPYFGPWLGAVPALLVAYLGGTKKFIWTLAGILMIQQLENAFITPKILSGAVDLHPAYIILSLWAGGLFFGVAGMFLAVPLILILRVIIKHIYLSIVSVQ